MVSLANSRQRNNWCEKSIDMTQIHLSGYIFLGSKITVDSDCSHEIKRYLTLERKAMTNLDNILKSRDITLPTKVHIVKTLVFPVVVYGCELDHKEELMLLNCGAGEDSWGSPGLLEIKPVNPKRNHLNIHWKDWSWNWSANWPPDINSWLFGKDPDAGKDWRQKEKGVAEDKMVREHHWLKGLELEQTPGESGGQRSLACCSPWGHTVRHNLATEQQQHLPGACSNLYSNQHLWLYGDFGFQMLILWIIRERLLTKH